MAYESAGRLGAVRLGNAEGGAGAAYGSGAYGAAYGAESPVRAASGALRGAGGVAASAGRYGSKPLPSGRPGTGAAAGAAPCVYQAGEVLSLVDSPVNSVFASD
ncbi:hypothetical protein DRB89_40860 [Streptomyces sp. ICC4]|nr:hypothetical protein DRB89_40860 [Streptomyces sp. ICC4]